MRVIIIYYKQNSYSTVRFSFSVICNVMLMPVNELHKILEVQSLFMIQFCTKTSAATVRFQMQILQFQLLKLFSLKMVFFFFLVRFIIFWIASLRLWHFSRCTKYGDFPIFTNKNNDLYSVANVLYVVVLYLQFFSQ